MFDLPTLMTGAIRHAPPRGWMAAAFATTFADPQVMRAAQQLSNISRNIIEDELSGY
jgi:hypothetical protein